MIDLEGYLRIADRHSEHIACAAGGEVLSAGEMGFDARTATLKYVTNQSTGYCPEPDSWPAVERALRRIGVEPPDGFTTVLVFRRCPDCGQRNIVKEGIFECGVCGSELPKARLLATEGPTA